MLADVHVRNFLQRPGHIWNSQFNKKFILNKKVLGKKKNGAEHAASLAGWQKA